MTKAVLGLLVIVTGVVLTGTWIDQAQTQSLAGSQIGTPLVMASAAHLAMLGFATIVSVDKPWGLTPRGRQLTHEGDQLRESRVSRR